MIARLGLTADVLRQARQGAADNGTDLAVELIACRWITEERLARLMAEALGVPIEAIDPDDRIIEAREPQSGRPIRLVKTCGLRLATKLFLQPRLENLDRVAALLAMQPAIRRMARLTTQADIRAALATRSEARRMDEATLSLARTAPRHSARTVVEAGQAATLAFAACALLAAFAVAPAATLAVLHPLFGVAFAACIALRLVAAMTPAPRETEPGPAEAVGPLPVYSVLVALY